MPLAVIAVLSVLLVGLQRWSDNDREALATAPPELQCVLWPVLHRIAAFHMRTQHGEDFGFEQLRRQWNLIFFGYLSCPDVCPTTLHGLANFRRELLADGPAAGRYRFLFVTVDPANDDAGRVAAYLA